MQTTLTPTAATRSLHPGSISSTHPAAMPAVSRPRRTTEMDSLLQTPRQPQATTETAVSLETVPIPGLFLGLRIALLFNAGLGILGFACYEAWTAMTH